MQIDWLSLAESPTLKPLVVGCVSLTAGIILWRRAEWIGENLTGHFTLRAQISTPTPGWMLKPFGLLLVVGGGVVLGTVVKMWMQND